MFLLSDLNTCGVGGRIRLIKKFNTILFVLLFTGLIPQKSYATVGDYYVIFAMVMNCLVLAINCATHGIEYEKPAGGWIRKLHGPQKVQIGYAIFGIWVVPNVLMLLDALLVW